MKDTAGFPLMCDLWRREDQERRSLNGDQQPRLYVTSSGKGSSVTPRVIKSLRDLRWQGLVAHDGKHWVLKA